MLLYFFMSCFRKFAFLVDTLMTIHDFLTKRFCELFSNQQLEPFGCCLKDYTHLSEKFAWYPNQI